MCIPICVCILYWEITFCDDTSNFLANKPLN